MKNLCLMLFLLYHWQWIRGQNSCINNCNAVNITSGVPSWNTIHIYGNTYAVDFDVNKYYRIDYYNLGPNLAKNFYISVNNSVVGNGVPFQYVGGDFRTYYYFDQSTPYPAGPESYLFIVYKKIVDLPGETFDVWDQQGQFAYNINSGCDEDVTISYPETVPEPVREYECYDALTASRYFNANGNAVRFDAGNYIQLQPGFETNLSGGSISMFIEGCFGAHRSMSSIGIEGNTIETSANRLVNLYPNPTQGNLAIKLPEAAKDQELKIRITDLQGRIVQAEPLQYKIESGATVNLDQLNPGIYFISIEGEMVNHYQKIIKQ